MIIFHSKQNQKNSRKFDYRRRFIDLIIDEHSKFCEIINENSAIFENFTLELNPKFENFVEKLHQKRWNSLNQIKKQCLHTDIFRLFCTRTKRFLFAIIMQSSLNFLLFWTDDEDSFKTMWWGLTHISQSQKKTLFQKM